MFIENPEGKSDITWRDRAKYNFADGTYKSVPWATELWARENYPDHFAHISRDDKTQIAFYPNETSGERGTPLRMRPGKYLQKYYGHKLTPDEINKWTGTLRVDGLRFGRTAKEIESIYKGTGNGTAACMSHAPANYAPAYSVGKHPVHAYVGACEVAFLEVNGRVTARTLVWPERKLYTRLYGDSAALDAALRTEGYKAGLFDGLPLIGVSLAKYFADAGFPSEGPEGPCHYLLCPYVDHIKWGRYDAESNRLILQTTATGATHSVQHGDGCAYPIWLAPFRPNNTNTTPRVDHAILCGLEGGKPLTEKEITDLRNEKPKWKLAPRARDTLLVQIPMPTRTLRVEDITVRNQEVLDRILHDPFPVGQQERAWVLPDQLIQERRLRVGFQYLFNQFAAAMGRGRLQEATISAIIPHPQLPNHSDVIFRQP